MSRTLISNTAKRLMMRTTISVLNLVVLLTLPLHAEDAPSPKPIELTIEAKSIETPILKYRLFPSEFEQREGNAVPILLRLPWEQSAWMTKVAPTLPDWATKPLNSPDWARFEQESVFPNRFYGELKRAAYRREAHWEYPIQETTAPYSILLPDAQGLRVFLGHGLPARIRYHLSRGELDLAREGILVGHANARHMSQTPFYILQLIAISHHRTMLDQTTDLIAQPNSPNLYWALTTLPDSLLSLDRAARMEADMFSVTFPAVKDFERPRSKDEWRKMGRQLVEYLIDSQELEMPKVGGELALEVGIRKVIDKHARPDLTTLLGFPAEKVAAMSDEEAGLRWYTHLRMSVWQRSAAMFSLSPRAAWPEFRRLQHEMDEFQTKTGVKLSSHFSPCSIYVSAWALKRKIDSLRVIEGVRHHLATHDGVFPTRLEDIEGVTLPLDPLTDLPFEWKVEGDTATLKAPPLPEDIATLAGRSVPSSIIEYHLQQR